jgi:ketosteroid isomerase-like protein
MMNTTIRALTLLLGATLAAPAPAGDQADIGERLDAFHQAASEADGRAYFALFAPDAVFIGTDATERWPLAAFRDYARPYFDAGQGWTYAPGERHIVVHGDTAWFDEMLDSANYGLCRGTGVLVRIDGAWRIAQYHLTVPVPNALLDDVVRQIRALPAAGDNP